MDHNDIASDPEDGGFQGHGQEQHLRRHYQQGAGQGQGPLSEDEAALESALHILGAGGVGGVGAVAAPDPASRQHSAAKRKHPLLRSPR